MKKSELKQMIRESIRSILNEGQYLEADEFDEKLDNLNIDSDEYGRILDSCSTDKEVVLKVNAYFKRKNINITVIELIPQKRKDPIWHIK